MAALPAVAVPLEILAEPEAAVPAVAPRPRVIDGHRIIIPLQIILVPGNLLEGLAAPITRGLISVRLREPPFMRRQVAV